MSQSPDALDKDASDAALEARFPEHPWRKPMPVAMLPGRKLHWACRFCAWRGGYLKEDAAIWSDGNNVIRHLRVWHPTK